MSTTPTHQPAGSMAIIAVLALLSVFPPLATDMYLSAFSEIQHHFQAPEGALELSLSVFFLGLCVGQLIFGPLVDRYGRKRPLMFGAGLFCVSTVLLLVAQSVQLFIALRFVQAVGACAGMVIGRAIVTDLYRGRAAARTMTLLMMLMTLGPIIAPLLGGVLTTAFGWRAVFIAMLLTGLIALLLTHLVLPETLPPAARQRTPLGRVFGNYRILLGKRAFITPALVSALVMGGMFSFITASSSVFQGVMSLSRIQYGLAFGGIALGLAVASFANSRLLVRRDVHSIINVALPAAVLVNLTQLLVADTRLLWVLMLPLWFAVALTGLLVANITATAMEAARGHAGAGSALLGALQFGVAFVCSSIVAALITTSATPLALGMLIPVTLAQLLWLFGGGRSDEEGAEGEVVAVEAP